MFFQANTVLLQGCFIKCEILQSPMISYRSLLFIVTTMNDKISLSMADMPTNPVISTRLISWEPRSDLDNTNGP